MSVRSSVSPYAYSPRKGWLLSVNFDEIWYLGISRISVLKNEGLFKSEKNNQYVT